MYHGFLDVDGIGEVVVVLLVDDGVHCVLGDDVHDVVRFVVVVYSGVLLGPEDNENGGSTVVISITSY